MNSTNSPETFQEAFLDNLSAYQGKDLHHANPNDLYLALAHTVREYLVDRWLKTISEIDRQDAKVVYYFSAEYLPGRQLKNNLHNAGITAIARQALAGLDLNLDELAEQESEPGLGNGGLGRLASCYLDSLATLSIPAVGYGIRYEYGIFQQSFQNGWQVEQADDWLRRGAPWEFPQPEEQVEIGFGGRTRHFIDETGKYRVEWMPDQHILGVPYNMFVPGYHTPVVNTLRLWSARATQSFDLQVFNTGDFVRAVEQKNLSENITKVLYPDDTTPQGKYLRLQQQYFFVACSLADLIRFYIDRYPEDWNHFPDKATIQLNDTHPTIAIPELMRLLVDIHKLEWEQAWEITCRTFAYTLHTLLPEALEEWPISIFEQMLPRHLEIIYEINRRFLQDLRLKFPNDPNRAVRMSLVRETPQKRVRMAYLAAVGSHSINGVSSLQSDLLKSRTLADFYDLFPGKFNNKTNGITPRRFLHLANPRLKELITRRIGPSWLADLQQLRRLEEFVADPEFCTAWAEIKQANKQELAAIIQQRLGLEVDPTSMFDVMVKRLHEYKRQLLKVLHIVTLYHRLRSDPTLQLSPRTFIFGAKAAPGYQNAKLIIKLINSVAAVVNQDPLVNNKLKVAFLPNFNVSLAERIYPAADLSEQISLAGMEASGTGNMKFTLNGAVTLGTYDGANIDIRRLVGAENFYLFGLTAEEVFFLRLGGYYPLDTYQSYPELRQTLDSIANGLFSPQTPDLFKPIVESLLHHDEYMLLADYPSYISAAEDAARAFADTRRWVCKSILNTARCGYFSSDRAVLEYANEIWRVNPLSFSG
jgi:glycogen phosphorylase